MQDDSRRKETLHGSFERLCQGLQAEEMTEGVVIASTT